MRHKRAHTQGSAACRRRRVLMCASVASMIDQFNMPNIRLLQEMGYEVHVLCNFLEGNTCSKKRLAEFQAQLREMGVVQHQWDCPRGLFPIRKCAAAFRQILRLLKEQEYAWMHCHSPVGGALARAAARRAGVSVVYTAHGFHFYKGAPLKNWLLYYPAERLLARWTDVLITVNKEDCRLARRRMRAGKVCRIPGAGIDTGRFAAYEPQLTREQFCRRYRIPVHGKILLSVGELSRRKNHRLVLKALPKLGEDVYYLICGQGKLRKFLRRDACRSGVSGRVRLAGYVEDLREIYSHADVFIFPSLQEGLPAALVEAMAGGLPCLVSDIRGNRELASPENRFRPGSAEELERKVKDLLAHSDRMRLAGRQAAARAGWYDVRIVEQKMCRIYKYMDAGRKKRDL